MTAKKRVMRVVKTAVYRGQALGSSKGRYELELEGCRHTPVRLARDRKDLPKKVLCRMCSA